MSGGGAKGVRKESAVLWLFFPDGLPYSSSTIFGYPVKNSMWWKRTLMNILIGAALYLIWNVSWKEQDVWMWGDGSIVLQIFSLKSRYCCPQYPTPAILHSFQREEKQPKRFHKSLDEVSNNNFENHWQIYLQRDQLINPEQIIICQVGQQIFLAMQVGFRWYLFALFF